MTKPIDTTEIRTRLDSKGWDAIHPYDLHILCDEIDRLRGEQQTPPQGETIPVRAVCVYKREQQQYVCYCESGATDDENHHYIDPNGLRTRVILAGNLPVPAEVCVVAKVEGE